MNQCIRYLRAVFICIKMYKAMPVWYAGESVWARSITIKKVYKWHSQYCFDYSWNWAGDILTIKTSSGLCIEWHYKCSHPNFIYLEIIQDVISTIGPFTTTVWILVQSPNGWLRERGKEVPWGSCIRWPKNICGMLSKCLVNLISALLI